MKTNPENVHFMIDYRISDTEFYTDHLCLPKCFFDREEEIREFYLACFPDRIVEHVWRVVPIAARK